MNNEYFVEGEVRELYPYFNTDDLALIFNMSRGWTARKIVASIDDRRTAGETRALEVPEVLPNQVYTTLTRVLARTGGTVPYDVRPEGILETDEETLDEGAQILGMSDEDIDDLFNNVTESIVDSSVLEDESQVVEPVIGDTMVDTDTPFQESELFTTDLLEQLRTTQGIVTMGDAYDKLADVTRRLGRLGVFDDVYESKYVAKINSTPPIVLGFGNLAELKNTVRNGVTGAAWEVGIHVSYLPAYTQTETLDEYLNDLQQSEQIYAGRFGTVNGDKLRVRIVYEG